MTDLPVAETFYSLQGEGPAAGEPSVFLRTGGCNLLCGAPPDPDQPQSDLEPNEDQDASWVCDTIEVWRNAETMTLADLANYWGAAGWFGRLVDGDARLIITGGEPMLHQESLSELLREYPIQHVDVETNGTIEPDPEFTELVDRFVVSPKLSNSGMPEDRRLTSAFDHYVRFADPEVTVTDALFKFVVGERETFEEVRDVVDDYDIPRSHVQLMPAGATKADLAETYPLVSDLCKTHGYHFSPRLHVDIWNTATGV